VTGQRSLNRHVGGFAVADFPDHDDVGVLTDDRPKAVGKRHSDLWIHLNLIDGRQADFNRIFNGDDFDLFAVQVSQGGMQRCGFSAAGRAGHQNEALRIFDHLLEALLLAKRHTQTAERKFNLLLIQQADHNAFAVNCRRGRHAHIEVVALNHHFNASVLRNAMFRDIQTGQQLQS